MNHVKTYPGEMSTDAHPSCQVQLMFHSLAQTSGVYDSELQFDHFFHLWSLTNLNSTRHNQDTTCCHKQELYVLYVVSKQSLLLVLVSPSKRSVSCSQRSCFHIYHNLLVSSNDFFSCFFASSVEKNQASWGGGGDQHVAWDTTSPLECSIWFLSTTLAKSGSWA